MRQPDRIRSNEPARALNHRKPGEERRVGSRGFNHLHGKGWKKRSKLDIAAAAEAINGNFPRCKTESDFMTRLRASKKKGVDLLHELLTYPEYDPAQTGVDALAASADMWTGAALADFQEFWINEITSHPFSLVGAHMADLIKSRGETLLPAVWPKLIKWFEGHPVSPRGFFAQTGILAKVPNTEAVNAALNALPTGRLAWPHEKRIVGGRAV